MVRTFAFALLLLTCGSTLAGSTAASGATPGGDAYTSWLGPTDWELDLDVRLVDSDGRRSVMNGGLGTVRFDQSDSGLRLGRARFAVTQPLGEVLSAHVDASAWGDHDRNPVDITEAYLLYRPYPFSGMRLRLKGGAFYAPISLENRGTGWDSPYTVSYSAINNWIGQELRTIGLEGQLDWLGSRMGHGMDLGFTGGVFGWNDPAGVVLANRGFSFSDRQTTVFGRVGALGIGPLETLQLFHEIDGHAGYYAGAEARYLDRLVVRGMHYDNRADGAAFDSQAHRFAWNTQFDAVGARYETATGWTAIVQWLRGETYIEPNELYLSWPFTARFALVSKQFGKHRISVRYDDFDIDEEGTGGFGLQHGHAWTAAYVLEPSPQWRLSLEWLQVSSSARNRVLELAEPAFARETQIQLAVRYALRAGG